MSLVAKQTEHAEHPRTTTNQAARLVKGDQRDQGLKELSTLSTLSTRELDRYIITRPGELWEFSS